MEEKKMSTERVPTTRAKVQQCPECGSDRLMRDYECAEIVCMNCGFVIAAKLTDREAFSRPKGSDLSAAKMAA